MSVLATVRPDDWNFPLFVHVLGAMILVAGLVTGAAALFFARGDEKLLRLGFWSLMLVSFPGWVVLRLGAQWRARSCSGLPDHVDDDQEQDGRSQGVEEDTARGAVERQELGVPDRPLPPA